jgi:hypothetical protein
MNRKAWSGFGAVAVLASVILLMGAQGQQPEQWLHVRVDDTSAKGEMVRVNLPLSVAEKVLPAIRAHKLEEGKIKLSDFRVEDVDIRTILAAVKDSADGEFVTVESKRENVRVAKQGGYLLVKVLEHKKAGTAEEFTETVDIKVPMTVVEAMLSAGPDELDVLAAIRALRNHGDAELVTVKERNQTVRIWIDSKNTGE